MLQNKHQRKFFVAKNLFGRSQNTERISLLFSTLDTPVVKTIKTIRPATTNGITGDDHDDGHDDNYNPENNNKNDTSNNTKNASRGH